MAYKDTQFSEACQMVTEPLGNFSEDIDGKKFAGRHLLVEVTKGKNLNDRKIIKTFLFDSVKIMGATLLHHHVHEFGEGQGISGMAMLAESHISIHTWPEEEYAAIDIFTCGNCYPTDTIPIIQHLFELKKEPYYVQYLRGKPGGLTY